MYHTSDHSTLSEATEAAERLRTAEAAGSNVQWVNLSERSTAYLRVFSTEKPYVVSWHTWSD